MTGPVNSFAPAAADSTSVPHRVPVPTTAGVAVTPSGRSSADTVTGPVNPPLRAT